MGLVDSVGELLTEESQRFLRGVRQLTDPNARIEDLVARPRGAGPEERVTVTVPGWDDVIRLGPRYRATPAEVDEFYAARRAGREPNISAEAREAIVRYRDFRDGVRRSAQDEYSKAWGQVLTAVDNVQDLLSTVATFGRLGLWAGPRVVGLAEALSPAAARAALGAGARIGGRFVPVLGWVILAGDLLNLLGLAGMVAGPLHALICSGPSGLTSAGLPTALFKRGLKQEVWNAARRNPFGRTARLAARSRAVGKLPGIGNLLEVGQTTEQLFGWGVSFGAIVGMLTETGAVLGGAAGDRGVEIRSPWARTLGFDAFAAELGRSTPIELEVAASAGRVLLHAPSIMATQDMFSTEDHLAALVAYAVAAPHMLARVPRAWDSDTLLEALDLELPVPLQLDAGSARICQLDGLDPAEGARWPVPGAPRTIRARELVELLAPRIAAATRLFIERRRDTVEGVFAAALISQTTEALWYQLTGDPDALRFQLAPDYQLLAGLAEDGWLVSQHDPPAALWAFWKAARRAVEERSGRYPGLRTLQALADQHGVSLIKLLPPDAPIPPGWFDAPALGGDGPIPAELLAKLRQAGARLPGL